LLHPDKVGHEANCEFRPYSCPYPDKGCNWEGALDQVKLHLMQEHKPTPTIATSFYDCTFRFDDINQPRVLVGIKSYFGHHFLFWVEKRKEVDGLFCATVQLIGTEKQAERFVYKLELKGQGCRLTMEDKPRSIREGFSSALASCNCLTFTDSTAQLFTKDGKVEINFSIRAVN